MKTTLDLPDALIERVQQYAKVHNRTLKSIACEGLERMLTARAAYEAHDRHP